MSTEVGREQAAPGVPVATPSPADRRDPAVLPRRAELARSVEVLRLLADPTRLAVLALLDGTELSVTAIAHAVDRPVPAVSQHLAKLRAGRLVTTRRDGTTVHYTQANEHVAALVANVLHHAEHTLYDVPPHHR
ncbi:ArsR/SmtB family transcription factor [Cellulomonas soli]|uniref:ArsR/SmtB family transcription factor n=1 Tax=Cellulomonas soli TaxID=931535 RepID=UPI0017B5F079|nr:metalloregulator ArsR/SmtB family transcription factor [Cellulomonas soli]NYI58845.1 DNA-binding transcriptional ArsR family regulator [Cellulomonas soli]